MCECLEEGNVLDPTSFLRECAEKRAHILTQDGTDNLSLVVPYIRNTYKQETARKFGEYGYGGLHGTKTTSGSCDDPITLDTCKQLDAYKGLYGASYNDSNGWPVDLAPHGCVEYGSNVYWNADENDNDCGSDGGVNCVCTVHSSNKKWCIVHQNPFVSKEFGGCPEDTSSIPVYIRKNKDVCDLSFSQPECCSCLPGNLRTP